AFFRDRFVIRPSASEHRAPSAAAAKPTATTGGAPRRRPRLPTWECHQSTLPRKGRIGRAALDPHARLMLDLGRPRPPRLLMPMDVISRGSAALPSSPRQV